MSENNPNRPGISENPKIPNDPVGPDDSITPEEIRGNGNTDIPNEFSASGVNDVGVNHPHGSNAPHDPAFSTDQVYDEKEYDKSVEQKPFYTKWWFWLIIIIIIVTVIYLNGSN